MEKQKILNQITELTEQIGMLPKGYISKKTISGKAYYYHQWSEGGVKQSWNLTMPRALFRKSVRYMRQSICLSAYRNARESPTGRR